MGYGTHATPPSGGQLKGSKETRSSCSGGLSRSPTGTADLTQKSRCGAEPQAPGGLVWALLAVPLRLCNSYPGLLKTKLPSLVHEPS